MAKVGEEVEQQNVLTKGARSEVGMQPQFLFNARRTVGYTLLCIGVFALAAALGAGVAVMMDYFWGWPNTTWL